MPKGFLIDVTRCIGCRGCQVACKRWNDLPAEKTVGNPGWTNPPRLSAKTWTLMENCFIGGDGDDAPRSRYVKRQCMHCLDPACVSACMVGALHKTAQGPVVYDESKCIGCRYCMVACPFRVPTFEWEKPLPLIRKCTFCIERMEHGLRPACSAACPTGAVIDGERGALLAEAKRRLRDDPDRYVPHVYGEKEVGGTCVLYLSDIPFGKMGFPEGLPTTPRPSLTWSVLSKTPAVVGGGAALLAGSWLLTRRRAIAEAEKHGDTGEPGKQE